MYQPLNRLVQSKIHGKAQAVHWAQQASSGLTQQLQDSWNKIDFSQPHWTQLAIAALLMALPTGVSLAAFRVMATPPQPRCNQPQTFQADFAQLQCLHQAMRSKEPSALIRSLQQLQNWSSESPVYRISQRLLEDWSVVALSMAHQEFEAGRWENAASLAAAIPASLDLSGQAQERLSLWETVRGQGETVYELALEALAQQDWQGARDHAKTLANLGNDYWRKQGLQALPEQIELARQAQQPAHPDEAQLSARAQPGLSLSSEIPPRSGPLPSYPQPALPGRSRFAMPLISLKKLTVEGPSLTEPEFAALV